ncbi:MAG: SCO family protein [Solirubrobacteraceae bacterium]|nr:SCO family protein [Solirubrobacteraceae bacterium]
MLSDRLGADALTRGRLARLLLVGATALAAVTSLALLAASAPGPDDDRLTRSATSAFRAGELPRGIAGARAPGFALRDAYGDRVDTSTLAGRPYVVTFLYTDCRDVCPLIAQELKLALRQLGARGREVSMLAVTADPEGDTPAAVRAWLRRQRMPDSFRYLVGDRREVEGVWRAHYAAGQPRDRAESAHSASIWLVDRRGRWRAKFSGGLPVAPADIAHDLRLLLDERS